MLETYQMKKSLYISIIILILLIVNKSYSTTYYSRTTGPWATSSTWSQDPCGGVQAANGAVPGSGDIVYICSGHTVTMDGNPGACQQLFINGIATWTANRTTNVGVGGINISSTGDITGASNGVLTTTGGIVCNKVLTSVTVTLLTQTTAGQTISGTGTIPKLTINTTTTNNGVITVTTTLAGTSTLTQGVGATLIYSSSTALPGTLTLNASASGNTVEYSGTGNQTVKSATYYNLTISNGGTSTLGGAITVNNNLSVTGGTLGSSTFQITGNATGLFTLANGCVLTLGTTASATVVNFPTNFITANISLGATSRVTYQGNYAQSISTTPSSYGNITLTTGAASVSKTPSTASPITITAALTLTNGVGTVAMNMGAQNLSVTGNITGTGDLTFTTGNLTLGGSYTATGVLTNGANTVTYNGAAQTVKSTTYNNLTFSGSNIKTLGGNITVNNDLTLSAGTLATSTYQITGNITGTFSMASTTAMTIGNIGSATNVSFPTLFTNSHISMASGTTVTYQANTAQTISSVPTYQNLTVNTFAGTKAANGNLTVQGNLVVTTSTLDMTTYTLNLTGNYTSTGALSFSTGNFNIGGNFTNSGTFTCGTGTVTYNGTTQTVRGATYNNLTISGSGVKTLGAATAINNNLAINAGTLATSTFQITGNVTGVLSMASGTALTIGNTGSVTNVSFPTLFTNANISLTSTSTVTYQANAAQTISSTPTYQNLTINTYSGTKAASGNLTVQGNLVTTSPSTLGMTTYTLNLTGNYTGTGGLSFTTGAFNITGTFTNSGTFTCGTSTVTYNGGSSQTVRGTTYNNLILSNAGAKTLGAATIVAGTITISSNLDVSASNFGLQVRGGWINNGAFTP